MKINRSYWILLFLLIFVIITIGLWVVRILQGDMPYVDLWTRDQVDWFSDTYMYIFFRYITEMGSRWFLVPFVVTVAIILWIQFKNWLPALIFSGGTLLTHLFNLLIKHAVERERPSIYAAANAEGYSFPSGHSMIPMVCYGLLAFFIAKKINSPKIKLVVQSFFALLIFLIGISRYVINVHFLTDIVAGFIIGFLLLIGFIYLYEDLHKRQSPSRD
ncbi:phosphatase PAP2 family protein [Virgibacillus kimchii]